MGVGVSGWIEFRYDWDEESRWIAVVNAGCLIDPSARAFACLFGVRNRCNWKPIAPHRGLPHDVSDAVREDAQRDNEWMQSHTWITQAEVKSIDWSESIDSVLVTCAGKAPSGVDYTSSYIHARSSPHPNAPVEPQEGDIWTEGDLVCRAERLKRLRAVEDTFAMTFQMMDMLASRFGEENVRLVVWFYD